MKLRLSRASGLPIECMSYDTYHQLRKAFIAEHNLGSFMWPPEALELFYLKHPAEMMIEFDTLEDLRLLLHKCESLVISVDKDKYSCVIYDEYIE